MAKKIKKQDETIEGGAYIRGGEVREDDDGTVKHFGGDVVDANGEILVSFDDDEENTGVAAAIAAKAPVKPPAKPDPTEAAKKAAEANAARLKAQQEIAAKKKADEAAAAKKAAEETAKNNPSP